MYRPIASLAVVLPVIVPPVILILNGFISCIPIPLTPIFISPPLSIILLFEAYTPTLSWLLLKSINDPKPSVTFDVLPMFLATIPYEGNIALDVGA